MRNEIRGLVVQAINDSRCRDPKGIDFFVKELEGKMDGTNGRADAYKLAWTKLTELLVILDKAGADVLDAHDMLGVMQYLLTASVCIRDKVAVEA